MKKPQCLATIHLSSYSFFFVSGVPFAKINLSCYFCFIESFNTDNKNIPFVRLVLCDGGEMSENKTFTSNVSASSEQTNAHQCMQLCMTQRQANAEVNFLVLMFFRKKGFYACIQRWW